MTLSEDPTSPELRAFASELNRAAYTLEGRAHDLDLVRADMTAGHPARPYSLRLADAERTAAGLLRLAADRLAAAANADGDYVEAMTGVPGTDPVPTRGDLVEILASVGAGTATADDRETLARYLPRYARELAAALRVEDDDPVQAAETQDRTPVLPTGLSGSESDPYDDDTDAEEDRA